MYLCNDNFLEFNNQCRAVYRQYNILIASGEWTFNIKIIYVRNLNEIKIIP